MTDETAEAKRDAAIWPYFIPPIWFAFVWVIDDALGAWLSCVGMLLATLFCLYEAGRKRRLAESHHGDQMLLAWLDRRLGELEGKISDMGEFGLGEASMLRRVEDLLYDADKGDHLKDKTE